MKVAADVVGEPGKDLAELLAGLEVQVDGEAKGVRVTAITADSREAGPGVLFVAIPGLRVDGHNFVAQAVAAGCAAVLVEQGRSKPKEGSGQAVWLMAEDTRIALGDIAAAFYDHPARRLKMIAITGTNGKTTTSYLLEEVLTAAGARPGVIGTVNYRFAGTEIPAPFTTPEPVQLQKLLSEMVAQKVSHLVMEVSSHALAQKRLQGVRFDVALFTNLSRDHLDFHGDMESYFAAKKQLFQAHLNKKAVAVIMQNGAEQDSEGVEAAGWGRRLARELADAPSWRSGERKIVTCGFSPDSDVHTLSASGSLEGLDAEISLAGKALRLKTKLVGDYNLKNILGCLGVGISLGLDPDRMNLGLARFEGVPGRLERVGAVDPSCPAVFVDYAHTPDALENVLMTLRKLTPGRVIVVFGCGGDRDRGKRPLMGEVAARLADVVLVTSDNPRSESPEVILEEIEKGIKGLPKMGGRDLLKNRQLRGYDVIASRREAIRVGVQGAGAGDVVLVSGKGHECYQLDRSGKKFFDDRVEAREGLLESHSLLCRNGEGGQCN